MKKTLTVNLNNIVFNIDDDAYEMLQIYLSEIAKHFDEDSLLVFIRKGRLYVRGIVGDAADKNNIIIGILCANITFYRSFKRQNTVYSYI